MSAAGVYSILFTIANIHLSSEIITEQNSAMGKSVNNIHLCKNLRLGLWIISLKFLIALDSGKQDLEKYRSSLKQEK
jgi:hypothetical protein